MYLILLYFPIFLILLFVCAYLWNSPWRRLDRHQIEIRKILFNQYELQKAKDHNEKFDLAEAYYFACLSTRECIVEVLGLTGHIHKVCLNSGKWRCDCSNYKKKGHCRHLAKAIKINCSWSQYIDGGHPSRINGKNYCPRCGLEVIKIKTWS